MSPERSRFVADWILVALVAVLAFLLGCQELFDADFWWHLRSGRWILEHRAVPRVDPFTYGSVGREWIDLHWLFQVALALAYAAAGVRGAILFAAGAVAAAVLVGLSCRPAKWPAWIVAAAWLPGILLASYRFDPRPELVTLFAIASYFGILIHARDRPEWLWLLVPVQILWINSHGLFVLGPWILGLFLIDRAVMPTGLPPWRQMLPPSVVTVASCLLNPYGVRGLFVPLELYPKLTEAGGAYKVYIAEFMSPRMEVKSFWGQWGHDLYFRLFVFLLVALPLVVLVPALWRTWTAAGAQRGGGRSLASWAGGMVALVGLAALVAAGIPVKTTPSWWVAIARGVPWLLAAVGIVGAAIVVRKSRLTAALALAGCGATSAWIIWLTSHLFDPAPKLAPGAIAFGLGLTAAILALRAGTRSFGLMLGATFAYLALLAIRNISLFGLVAGMSCAAELGEWAAQMAAGARLKRLGAAAWCGVVAVIGLLATSVVTGRFFPAADDYHRFGLRERPFHYAHDACRFASGRGLPDRALAFGLMQASVWDFHNAPARRVFIDGRLEVASRGAFERYAGIHIWLALGNPLWKAAMSRLGNPMILADHTDQAGVEATLLADPDWRCVYQDAVASVFLPRGQSEEDLAAERSHPTINFSVRHFQCPPVSGIETRPGAALAEARALLLIDGKLGERSAEQWALRIPIGLVAMDRARQAVADSPGASLPWLVLGNSALVLVRDHDLTSGDTAATSDPGCGLLPWAQACFAYREALRRDPTNDAIARSLSTAFAMRGMNDAGRALEKQAGDVRSTEWNDFAVNANDEQSLTRVLGDLLRRGRPQAAVVLAEFARSRGRLLPWAIADRIAFTHLQLGDPMIARRTWMEALDPPSQAILAARAGDAALARWDLEAAKTAYHQALSLEPNEGEAWVGMALVGLETGDADLALHAAQRARRLTTAPDCRWVLDGIVLLCEPYAGKPAALNQ
jgi:tetratricopeptide (TPR) repeat protein